MLPNELSKRSYILWIFYNEQRGGVLAPTARENRGAGGTRTLVQTSNENAFYMLRRCLIFEE